MITLRAFSLAALPKTSAEFLGFYWVTPTIIYLTCFYFKVNILRRSSLFAKNEK